MKKTDKFEPNSNEITFVFDNEEAAGMFKTWMCEMGEQSYRDSMSVLEEEYEGSITGIDFDYWTGDGTIPVKCGRLDTPD